MLSLKKDTKPTVYLSVTWNQTATTVTKKYEQTQ